MKQNDENEVWRLAASVARLIATQHVMMGNEVEIGKNTEAVMMMLQQEVEDTANGYIPLIMPHAAKWIAEIDIIRSKRNIQIYTN